jgi:hypothetical protein
MSVFKSQFSRALEVIRSDNADIPFPNEIKSGTNTSAVTNQLVDSTGNFINLNVKTGDIVYNITDQTAATVVSVTSATVIVLNANIFAATAKSYIIYEASSQSTIGNRGCNLYIGGAGNVRVTTIGGDIVTFTATPVGQVLPVQVIKVHLAGTSATLIDALW